MLIIPCIILGAAVVALLLRLFAYKREIRRLNLALLAISNTDTNAQLTAATFDKDIIAFAKTINTVLEQNRQNIFEKLRTETNLKRAVTNISHDLRTPLTAARGYLQMLESGNLDAATRSQYLTIVQERLDALSALMNSLFEFARVMEGDFALDMQNVNICNAIRDVLSTNYSELERRGFTVDVQLPAAPVICNCDPDAFERVLQNLIKNACIHGRDYLRIRLDGSIIEIANKADGLDELDMGQIFERFYTSDASRSNKSTGLGLAIVKELAERMGGQVSAGIEQDLFVIRVAF